MSSQGSIYVYQVRDALNKYKPNGIGNYTYKLGTSMTQSDFEGAIAASLTNCKPVILHAKTKYLSYYKGKNIGHYLSVDTIDRTADVVRIVDCNNDDDDDYGKHPHIPISEAYKAISKESGRYLIY